MRGEEEEKSTRERIDIMVKKKKKKKSQNGKSVPSSLLFAALQGIPYTLCCLMPAISG
jgi:hypothetical protein